MSDSMVVAFGLNSEPDVIPDLMGNLTYVAHLFLSLVGFIRRQLYQLLHPCRCPARCHRCGAYRLPLGSLVSADGPSSRGHAGRWYRASRRCSTLRLLSASPREERGRGAH